MTPINSYIEFLQYCLNDCRDLPESSKSIDWKRLMTWAEKQTIVGVVFQGVQKAGKNISMPFDTLMEWVGYAQQIEMQNRLMNQRCVEVLKEYQSVGLDTMILKGQGNATMYPNPLARTSGDIDLWVKNATREEIVNFTRFHGKLHEVRYYHAEYAYRDVLIEAHFMPGIMNNPLYNVRLQKFYKEYCASKMMELPEMAGAVPIPMWEFNVVFQLAHMMHHFFDEGIGLRQMIDYYYLLKVKNDDVRVPMEDLGKTLKFLNLYNFATAAMHITKEVLGLEEKYQIVPVDEKRGKTLLREIMHGGNFGHSSNLDQNNMAKKYFQKTWRNMKLVKEYPAEALCEPVFRTWHYFWRLRHK